MALPPWLNFIFIASVARLFLRSLRGIHLRHGWYRETVRPGQGGSWVLHCRQLTATLRFHLPHQLGMARPFDLLFFRRAVEFGADVVGALASDFLLFDDQWVSFGVGVLTNSGNLPGNLHVRRTGANGELVAFDFAGYDGLGELTDHGQLVTKIGIEGFDP